MIGKLRRLLDAESERGLNQLIQFNVVYAFGQGVVFALMVPVLRAILGEEPSDAWPLIGLMALATIITVGAYWISAMTAYNVGVNLSRLLHHQLGDHVASLPLGWFDASRTGTMGRLATKGVTDVMGIFAHLLRPIIAGVVTPLTVLVVMTFYDWRLAAAMLVSVPLVAGGFRLVGYLVGRSDHAVHHAAAEAGGRIVEFARIQAVLRAFRRTTEGYETLDDALSAQHAASKELLVKAAPGLGATVLALQTGFTVVLAVSVSLAIGGEVDVAELVALLALAVRFVEPLMQLADLAGAVRIAENSLDRIITIIDTPPLAEPEDSAVAGEQGAVELVGVTFGYEKGTAVLRDLDLVVPPRTVTALVGPSGSGKTTVIRLIARFYDVDAGVVRVGGADVRDLTTVDLMSQVSPVFQDVYLFEGTIADNIRIGRPDASDEEVRAAGRMAQVEEIVARLPDGWDTQVGEAGTSLSGGERQRVSIARAILKDAPIVLLDEATSALDPENEAAVQEAIAALTANRTVIVIAHRLQTVTRADQIVVLEEGRVTQRGTHEELLAVEGRYATFWAERSRAAGWRLAPADA